MGSGTLDGLRAAGQILLLCLMSVSAIASERVIVRSPIIDGKDLRFTHISTEQGLSQSRVDHLLQDSQGFLWIGTYNGLNRYDGYHFYQYKPEANNPNSIGGVLIHALFQDRSGALWIGVDQELDRFDPATDKFVHFRSIPADPASLGGHVEHITQDSDGLLWLATRNGLDRMDPISGTFTHYRNDTKNPQTLASNDIRFVYEDRQGTLWVATAGGLDAFDRRTGKVIRHYHISQQPPLDRIFEDRSGTLWLSATRAGGLTSLDRNTGLFTTYIFFHDWPGTPGMRGCSAILEDEHGMLWLATKPDGVLRFDRTRRLFTRYKNHQGNPASINNNEALSLIEDREGGIWVGTNGGGVNRFPSEPSPFTPYRREPENPNTLDPDNVLSVFEDTRGILWIGTNQLNRFDRKTGRYTFYRHEPGNPRSISAGTIYGIVEDHAGFLWFGTWGGGLNRLDRRTGEFKAYWHDPANLASLSNDYIRSLILDRDGNVWAGTEDGLNRMDLRTGRFTVYRFKDPIEARIYRVLAEGADRSIWMGTYDQGLQRLNIQTDKIVSFRHDPKVRGSLSNNRVNALCLDHTGTLWVGTQNGLNRFDPHTGEFTIFDEHDGLPNNAIEGILEDARGNLWVSTGNGLSKFDLRSRTVNNYFTDDGLAGDEFNDSSVYFKSARGEMFFGGVKGVTAFFPDRVTDSSFVPPVVLTEFRLFGKPVGVGGNSPLQRSISFTGSVSLSYAQNNFSLEFASLSYGNPLRNRYRYKLEGLNDKWTDVDSTHRLVTFPFLPPGNYTFRVQGSSDRSVWNKQGVTLIIRVLPPFWATWWFRFFGVGLFLTLLSLYYQLRVLQLRRQFEMTLQGRVAERTRIARELHDTLLQSFHGLLLRFQTVSQLLPQCPIEAKDKMESAITQAAEVITEARDAVQGLRASTIQSSGLALAISALGEELATDTGNQPSVHFAVTTEGEERDLRPLVRDEIYKIATEALRNAFRHAQAKQVEVEIRYDDEQFRLRVRDDGKGIDQEVFSTEVAEGHYGLRGIRERATIIGGQLAVWSQPGAGTEMELRVPASAAYASGRRRSWLSRKFGRGRTLEGSRDQS